MASLCYRSKTVHPDLDRLIRLQALDSRAAEARRLQSSIPETQRALDQKLDGARAAVTAANEQQAANQTSRRALEKDLAAVNTRLTRYKDQLMEVKTNREYHAMQHEIETAQGEVKRVEDQMLELMVAADDLSATLKSAEASLKTAEQDITTRARRSRQAARRLGRGARGNTGGTPRAGRADVRRACSSNTRSWRKAVAASPWRRRGPSVCTECHVRLRPMIYPEVRHNKTLVQCDSCQRFLYYVPPPAEGASASA